MMPSERGRLLRQRSLKDLKSDIPVVGSVHEVCNVRIAHVEMQEVRVCNMRCAKVHSLLDVKQQTRSQPCFGNRHVQSKNIGTKIHMTKRVCCVYSFVTAQTRRRSTKGPLRGSETSDRTLYQQMIVSPRWLLKR